MKGNKCELLEYCWLQILDLHIMRQKAIHLEDLSCVKSNS